MVTICYVTNNLVSKCCVWVICNLLSVTEYAPNDLFLLAGFTGTWESRSHLSAGHNPGEGTELPPAPSHSVVILGPGGELLPRFLAEVVGQRDFRLFICLLDEFPDSSPHCWYQKGDNTGLQRQRDNSLLPPEQFPGKVAKAPRGQRRKVTRRVKTKG